MNDIVRLGIVGLGNIGRRHVENVQGIPRAKLTAVCDAVVDRAHEFARQTGAAAYTDYNDMMASGTIDAVIIAVPHYDHAPVAVAAFAAGIHVLCEKPLAVHVADADKIITAYEQAKEQHPSLVFAMMFNERTFPMHLKIKEILSSGTLGQLIRATWINTKWFRTQAYYDSGSWRATWEGEGGGILTNQCPHNLDMYQWLFGLPQRIRGHAHIGKYHDIEVEDEVTAYFEHENGMIGHFIVSTAESPGTNRLEVVGEYGKLVFEDDQLRLWRNEQSMLVYSRETDAIWGRIQANVETIDVNRDVPSGHGLVAAQFVDAIVDHTSLIAKGHEGLGSVTLANGIMLSSFLDRVIELPFDPALFEAELQARIEASRRRRG
ncbi:MAG: Gfo/Idh/MocA family oxidoreductase [Firmicutes bacterium]|nr:Gfo/Idh/MocA family oxidoreductase [Bacillota bacterium]